MTEIKNYLLDKVKEKYIVKEILEMKEEMEELEYLEQREKYNKVLNELKNMYQYETFINKDNILTSCLTYNETQDIYYKNINYKNIEICKNKIIREDDCVSYVVYVKNLKNNKWNILYNDDIEESFKINF